MSLTPVINLCHGFSVIAGVVDTDDNDTGNNFVASDNDTGEQLSPVATTQEQGRHGGGGLPGIGES